MAGLTQAEPERWPDVVVFLGDQVYADDTSPKMKEFIASRRDPRAAAVERAQGLPGVRPPLPARVERPGQPVAALDPAERDDLRRPRHPRRLEHQLDLAPADGGHRLVARAGGGRSRVVLGLPAPGQPRGRGSRRGQALEPDRRSHAATTSWTSPRSSTSWPTARTRSPRRTAGASPATTTPRPGWSSSTHGRPACSSPTSARCSTTTRWPGSTSGCAATSTTCWSARRCRC